MSSPPFPQLPSADAAWLAIPLAALVYALMLYDARRQGSPSAGDDQLGIKLVAVTLAVLGTWVLSSGLRGFLLIILTFDDVWDRLKAALPSIVVGTLVLVSAGPVLLPRTNAAHYPKAKRLAAGMVALVSGVALVPALVSLLDAIFTWPSWRVVATALSAVLTAGIVFVAAFAVLGRLSGVRMPERLGSGGGRPAAPSYPPHGAAPYGQPLGGMVQPVPPAGYSGQPGVQVPPGTQPPGTQPPGAQPPGGWPAP